MASLGERLRRLRRDDPAPEGLWPDEPPVREQERFAVEPPTGLAALEQHLRLADEGGLSLKERLERLVTAAARGRARAIPPPRPQPVPLEELVQGRRVENERGEYFVLEEDVHLETLHGGVPLSRAHALDPASARVLTGDQDLEGFDLREAVFLDTETTGLAGGTGTAAFLIGVGWVEGDRFRMRQYFMRDYHEEAALLFGLARDIKHFSRIVTYNGKSFDVPLLESRYRMNRDRFPLSGAAHLDLLFPARRLWKARLESCRLQVLEAALLGVRRVGDVPGEEIPAIYFDFVRRRDARAMVRVLDHNRIDVLSLAALSVLAFQWVEGGHAEDPRDVFSLGKVFERAELYEKSEELYRTLTVAEGGPMRVPSLLRLAARAKKSGRVEAAVSLWQEAAREGDWWALRELALHHEHRSRDLGAALDCVESALQRTRAGEPGLMARLAHDFRRRRARLTGKISRRKAAGSSVSARPDPRLSPAE